MLYFFCFNGVGVNRITKKGMMAKCPEWQDRKAVQKYIM